LIGWITSSMSWPSGASSSISTCTWAGRTASIWICRDEPDYDKIVGIFTPALINAQKQYARDLLTHVNPYRGVRYADDPAVAFVEITNEDSLFMWGADETADTPPTTPDPGPIHPGCAAIWVR
jgi:hypothetical protein